MRITRLDTVPIETYPYWSALAGGQAELIQLPIVRGTIAGLSKEVDGLIVTADLQGKVVDEVVLVREDLF